MILSNEIAVEKIDTATTTPASVKDAGRVKIGAGAIHFSDPTPAREATKDAGRVRIGAGAIQF